MTTGQTVRLKKQFLERFAELGNVTAVCRELKLRRATVYEWQEKDERFLIGFHEAEIQATEILEAEARRRAVEGVRQEKGVYFRDELIATEVKTEYSDTLLIFLLKARAPEKYRERYDVTTASQPLIKAYEGVDLEKV